MATSTILEPISVNNAHGAELIVEALERAEKISYQRSEKPSSLTTDPESIQMIASKAMAGVVNR